MRGEGRGTELRTSSERKEDDMKTYDVLREAGDVLYDDGWCRGDYENGGRHCIVGATRSVLCEYMAYAAAIDIINRIVDYGHGVGSSIRWNDDSCSCEEEAQSVLDAAYVVALQIHGIEPGDVL
jgi:hypothetical protein